MQCLESIAIICKLKYLYTLNLVSCSQTLYLHYAGKVSGGIGTLYQFKRNVSPLLRCSVVKALCKSKNTDT